jgi:ADP-ribose pyrophosphatase YjhB (NUDIX family)
VLGQALRALALGQAIRDPREFQDEAREPPVEAAIRGLPGVCGVVLLRGDAALLQLRDDKPGLEDAGLWVFPGGHQEAGETPEEAARRTPRRPVTLGPLARARVAAVMSGTSVTSMTFFALFDGRQSVQCREGRPALHGPSRGRLPRVASLPRDAWDQALRRGVQQQEHLQAPAAAVSPESVESKEP